MINAFAQPFDRMRQITAIERSPLLDQEYYEAQVEQTFRTRREAVTHFHDIGLAAGFSLTPLFQDEWYRFHTSRDGTPCFLSFFFGAEALNSTSPFFDARVYAAECAAQNRPVPSTVREAMEQFVIGARGSTILPTPEWSVGHPTLDEARALAIRTAGELNIREHYIRPRLTTHWEPDPALTLQNVALRPDVLVSTVMPVRNRAGIVGDAIRSVIAQSHTNWELIVVDDGSTDDTVEVVRSFAATDPRIRVVAQPPSGVCAARNTGIDLASGEFIAFIDSDNSWLPDFIALTLPAFDDQGVVAAHAAAEFINEHGANSFLAIAGDRDDLLNGGNFIDLNTLIARRAAVVEIGGFDPALRRWVDFDLVIRLAELGALHFVPMVGVAYSYRSDVKRISTVEPNSWEQVVLSKYLLDWPSTILTTAERTPGLVSIVMPTYADWRMTVDAVQSILSNSGDVPFELLVVDNGSPRSVRDILTASLWGDERVRMLDLPRNTNFALGSNLGFVDTNGEFVLILNNDALVEQDWLAPLVTAMTADSGLSGVQPLVYSPSGDVESSGVMVDPVEGLPRNLTETPTSLTPVPALSGIACLYRADLFARNHGFDPFYSNGLEDADFALRLAELTGRTPQFAVVPESRVTHFSVFSPGRFAQETNNEKLFTSRWPVAV